MRAESGGRDVPAWTWSEPFSQVVSRVISYTEANLQLEREDWQKAVYLNGLLGHGQDELHRRWVDRAVDTQTSFGQFAYGSMDRQFQMRMRASGRTSGWWSHTLDERFLPQTNPAALGMAVLEWYERTRDETYLQAASAQARCLVDGNRTSDGAISQYAGVPYLFVDAVYMMCPFLCRFGAASGSAELVRESVRQLWLHAEHLLDERVGLFRHVWCERPDHFPQSTFWARGNGWVVAALVDILSIRDAGDVDRDSLVTLLAQLADRLVGYQDRSGFWHNVVDHPSSWLETSGTALIAYGLQRGVAEGHLNDSFAEPAARACRALSGVVDPRGGIGGVAAVPGGPEVTTEVNPLGQGTWLLAMAGTTVTGRSTPEAGVAPSNDDPTVKEHE